MIMLNTVNFNSLPCFIAYIQDLLDHTFVKLDKTRRGSPVD